MENELLLLAMTAGGIGVLHTLLGPDHYVPFIMLRRARNWSFGRTMAVTAICGVGHVLSSILLGAIGIAFGIGLQHLEWVESSRGSLAAWLLIAFGLAYFAWGVRQAWRNKPHKHWHTHADGAVHTHEHTHQASHAHVHEKQAGQMGVTPWFLFVIFIFGPCEALIPMLMYPALEMSLAGVVFVTAVFGGATLLTMLAVVTLMGFGLSHLRFGRLERFGHAAAGAAVACCGGAIVFLGI